MKYIPFFLFVILLSACSNPFQPACDGKAIVSTLQPLSIEWSDAVSLAGSTPRMSLAAQVEKLQDIRRRTEAATVPTCAVSAKTALVQSMNDTIAGFLAFLGNKTDAEVQPFFEKAATEMTQFTDELVKLQK